MQICTLFLELKPYLEVLALLGAVLSFWYGRHLLRYKLDEPTRKLYLENCFKVQIALDRFVRTGNITLEDINAVALANQEAELYLNNEITDLTKNIWDTMAYYHSYVVENEKTGERNHIEELSRYKEDLFIFKKNLTSYYRKHLVYEKPKFIRYLEMRFKKERKNKI